MAFGFFNHDDGSLKTDTGGGAVEGAASVGSAASAVTAGAGVIEVGAAAAGVVSAGTAATGGVAGAIAAGEGVTAAGTVADGLVADGVVVGVAGAEGSALTTSVGSGPDGFVGATVGVDAGSSSAIGSITVRPGLRTGFGVASNTGSAVGSRSSGTIALRTTMGSGADAGWLSDATSEVASGLTVVVRTVPHDRSPTEITANANKILLFVDFFTVRLAHLPPRIQS